MSIVVYIFILKIKNLYKTEQKKLIVQFEKKKVDHLSKTELRNKYWIVAHLKRFCLTHHLLNSYTK
jgi:hypothetical protein